jgi:hypothetical protein
MLLSLRRIDRSRTFFQVTGAALGVHSTSFFSARADGSAAQFFALPRNVAIGTLEKRIGETQRVVIRIPELLGKRAQYGLVEDLCYPFA